MDQEQAAELGRQLRARREELGLSLRDVERLTDIDNTTIVRFEQGAIAAPAPDKLSRIAEALGLNLADVYALAGYAVPAELPGFALYLRAKYPHLSAMTVEELERRFRRAAKRYGYELTEPAPGEDERPEPKRGGR